MRVSVCLFACISIASAISPHRQDGFFYTRSQSMFRRHSDDECQVCFGLDCVPLKQANCEYYMATSELQNFPEDEEDDTPNPELKAKVDSMLFDFVERTQEYQNMECIPMISKYTDCSKENLCLGCQTCSCEDGRWTCDTTHCRAEKPVGSKELMIAVASLKGAALSTDDQLTRKKRSTNGTSTSDVDTNITFEELSRWMHDTPPSTEEYEREIVLPTERNFKLTTSSPDYLAFDEVLSNIAIDNNNVSRKKPALEPVDDEYVRFVDIVSGDGNTTHDHKNRYTDNVIFDSKYSYDGDSFKVDLLEDLKNRLEEQFGGENYTAGFVNDVKNNRASRDFETSNYLDESNLSIVKRDVSHVTESNVVMESNVVTKSDVTEAVDDTNNTVRDFKNNVLQPLISIIEDKENELNQLHSIKASLVELIKAMDSNFTVDQMSNNTEKNRTLFSIYKLEIVPERQFATRRTGAFSIAEMYKKKLKRDVYEILRDLKGIKQNMVMKRLPRELESLFHAMSRYIHQQESSYLKNFRQYKGPMRRFMSDSDTSIKLVMYEILELCDKELAGRESLNQLSDTARDVLERVIKQNQIPEFATSGYEISRPSYHLAKDLKSIGTKWPELSKRALHSSPPDQIYHLKLLQLMLIIDMHKIIDALNLLEVNKNRRTILDTESSDQEMNRIENDLRDLNKKVQYYLQKGQGLDKNVTLEQNDNTITEQGATEKVIDTPSKKNSFLGQIKMLFRKSRQDIRNMLHKKISKTEIVKELAKNKLDEIAKQKMAQYEETLRKWQTKLGGARVKRSNFEYRKTKDRIKNILPLYLRGKVHPAIQESKIKKKHAGRSEIYRKYYNRSNVVKSTTKKPNQTTQILNDRKKSNTRIIKRIEINTNITKRH